MIRVNLKLMLFLLCIIVICMTLPLWMKCGEVIYARKSHSIDWNSKKPSNSVPGLATGDLLDHGTDVQGFEEIDCSINGEYTVSCRKEGGEVYVPFSFLNKYYEVFGKLATYDGYERFEWSHSYSKIYKPKGKYDPKGVFMYFENYNVEVRERVKCVSAVEGVPVSTQWQPQGYFYPTQIAQFGLAHYSKNMTEPEPHQVVVEDGDKERGSWRVPKDAELNYIKNGTGNYIVCFKSEENIVDGVTVQLDHVMDLVLSLNFRLEGNGSFTVTLQNREKREWFYLHYISSDLLISAQDQHTYHGIGHQSEWRLLTRDLIIDLQKGLAYQKKPKRKLFRSKIKVVALTFHGTGCVDNITLSSSQHIAQFYDAARWLVNHQDSKTGGWPNAVRRRLSSGMLDLEPGWYSAMGQGHAISVLARAYHHSGGDPQYLQAAVAGLKPFRVSSQNGGVLAMFLNQLPWYEEYPTQPSSFVLNGFIYSLLGLYDLQTVAPSDVAAEAADLFKRGMRSLKTLLPLFDTGFGSVYDLRHFTLGTAPNLARWDYHATHVNQLLLLATIDSDTILAETADRWAGYMMGKHAAHN